MHTDTAPTRVSGWDAFAKIAQAFSAAIAYLRPDPKLPPISDHIARDIGLSAHQLDQQRFEWPSTQLRHPML